MPQRREMIRLATGFGVRPKSRVSDQVSGRVLGTEMMMWWQILQPFRV